MCCPQIEKLFQWTDKLISNFHNHKNNATKTLKYLTRLEFSTIRDRLQKLCTEVVNKINTVLPHQNKAHTSF